MVCKRVSWEYWTKAWCNFPFPLSPENAKNVLRKDKMTTNNTLYLHGPMQMQSIIILQLAELISFHQNPSFVKGVLITHGYHALNSIQPVWICTANFTPSRPLLTGRCRCTCLDADCSLRFWNEDILLIISSHTLLSISSTCGRPKNWLREVVGRMELASSRGKRSESRGMSWCRVQMSSRGWVKIGSHDIDSLLLSTT